VGSTDLATRLDPEDYRDVVARYFERAEGVIARYGGYVAQHLGDGLLVYFGWPQAWEDGAARAVHAGLALVEVGAAAEVEAPRVRVGLHTGEVVVGRLGAGARSETLAVGDTPNIAARVQSAAAPDTVVMSATTHALVTGLFVVEDRGAHTLKGVPEPMRLYRALQPTGARGRLDVAADRLTPFVGRQAELDMLLEACEQVREGSGQVAVIVGDAGIGKSRLVYSLRERLRDQPHMWLEGRCLAMTQGLAFHPFVDLLRAWAGIVDDDDEQASLVRLEAAVTNLAPDQVGDILPPVATLMGMRLTGAHADRLAGITGEPLERLIMRSMRELVQTMARARPLVLVFEDLHWSDASSQKLLEFLLRLVADTPVMFVLLSRPDAALEPMLRSARETVARALTEIPLQPLGPVECETLIRNLLRTDELPPALRAAIADKAEGNPFFIEEVIRSLVDQGALEERQGHHHVSGSIGAVVVPSTIEGVIMVRVDRLAPRPRRLLQIASVLGRRFERRVLAMVAAEEGEIELSLRHLTQSQLLIEARDHEEVEYVFKHALILDTVYGSILQRTRKQLHAAVAQAMESVYGQRLHEFFGMLAYHWSRAEDLDKAEDYLFKAGELAARSAAPSEALRYFREAARLYLLIHGTKGDARKLAQLERNIALALFQTGNLTESIEHFDRGLGLLGDTVRTTGIAAALGFGLDAVRLLCWLYNPLRLRRPRAPTDLDRETHAMRYQRALAQMTSDPRRYFVDSIGMFRRLSALDPNGVEQAPATYAGGAALFAYSGVSLAISRRFLAIAEDVGMERDAQVQFFCRTMRFVYDYLAGNWEDERVIEEPRVEAALRRGQVWEVFVYRGLESERRAHRGDFAAAAREIEGLQTLSEVYGFYVARSNEYAMSAVLALEQRRLEVARQMIERYYTTQHEEVFHLFALGTKVKIQVLAGDRAGAAETLAKAEELVARMGRVNVYHLSVFLTGRLLYDVDAIAAGVERNQRPPRTLVRRARRSAREAVRIAGRVARERVEVYRLAGTLAWLLGRRARALGWWRRSLAAGSALGARPELARTLREIGHRLSTLPPRRQVLDGIDAAAYLEMARAGFDEIDLSWDLESGESKGDLRAAG
jgi:class 3 adenylate cyclase/tetratricopeptide (TPR) repeat protein